MRKHFYCVYVSSFSASFTHPWAPAHYHMECKQVTVCSSAHSLHHHTHPHTHTHTHTHSHEHVSSRHHPAPSLLRPGADFLAWRWGFNEQQGQRRAIYSMHSLIRDINNLDQDWTLNLELWALDKFISICQCLRLLSMRLIVPLGQWDESSRSAYAIFPPSILWEKREISLISFFHPGSERFRIWDRIMTDLHCFYRACCS